jgi:hypothetical protein
MKILRTILITDCNALQNLLLSPSLAHGTMSTSSLGFGQTSFLAILQTHQNALTLGLLPARGCPVRLSISCPQYFAETSAL